MTEAKKKVPNSRGRWTNHWMIRSTIHWKTKTNWTTTSYLNSKTTNRCSIHSMSWSSSHSSNSPLDD